MSALETKADMDTDDDCRLAASISRTRSRIFELAGCNPWTWFFTGTLNPEWNDVSNLGAFREKLTQGIRDLRKRQGIDVKYLLIPEHHKSGAWHVHGLLYGLSTENLHKFSASEHLPYRILDRVRKHDDVYNWEWYSQRFGYTTLTPIRDLAATSAYVTKYITKELANQALESGAHSFYATHGLHGATVLFVGEADERKVSADYEDDHVKVFNFGGEYIENLSDIFYVP